VSLATKMAGGKRGWIRWGILAAFTIVVFALLSTRLDYSHVREVLFTANLPLLVLAFAVTILFPTFSALRWKRMLRALGYKITFREGFDMIMAAWPMGTITPSKTGDFVKAYYLKGRVPVRLVLGSVLAERTVDILVLLTLAFAGCLAFGRWELALVAGGGLLVALTAIAVLLRARLPIPEKFAEKAEGVLRSLRLLAGSPSLLAEVVLYTVLNWMASVAQLSLCYIALGHPVPFLLAVGALPLAIFVGLLPLTLSGMGTRDSAIIVLFQGHASPEVSLGVGLLYTLFGYWIPSLIGLPFLKRVLPR
jgi:glycosyltransferase 2 family protein